MSLVAALVSAAMAGAVIDAEHEFHFIVLGDSQFDDPPAYNRLIDDVRALRPAFVIQVGDMIEGYTDDADQWRAEWRRYRAQIAPLGEIPFVPVPGNHDLYGANRQPSRTALSIYEALWGPAYRTFTYENARFVVLNSDGPDASGRIDRKQWQWLEHTLEANTKPHVFVFLHRPPGSLSNARALHQLFAEHSVGIVFYGHHHHYHFDERDGVRYIMTNAGGDSALEFAEVGSFDHLLHISVRDESAHVAVLRADTIIGTRAVTPEDNYQLFDIKRRLAPPVVDLEPLGPQRWQALLPLRNPASRALTVYTECRSADGRWAFSPQRIPAVALAAKASQQLTIELSYAPNRVPEGAPSCTVSVPYQTSQGRWLTQELEVLFQGENQMGLE